MKVPALTPEQEATLRQWQIDRPPGEPLDSMLSAFFATMDALRVEIDLAKSGEEFAVARWKQLIEQRAEVRKYLSEMLTLCETQMGQHIMPLGPRIPETQFIDHLKTILKVALANVRCPRCADFGLLPNRMDAPGHPKCACGRDSVHESGQCEVDHGPVWCDCPMGVACKQSVPA